MHQHAPSGSRQHRKDPRANAQHAVLHATAADSPPKEIVHVMPPFLDPCGPLSPPIDSREHLLALAVLHIHSQVLHT